MRLQVVTIKIEEFFQLKEKVPGYYGVFGFGTGRGFLTA